MGVLFRSTVVTDSLEILSETMKHTISQALLDPSAVSCKSMFLKYYVLNWILGKSIHMCGTDRKFDGKLPSDWTLRNFFELRLTTRTKVEQINFDFIDVVNDVNPAENRVIMELNYFVDDILVRCEPIGYKHVLLPSHGSFTPENCDILVQDYAFVLNSLNVKFFNNIIYPLTIGDPVKNNQ